MTEPSPTSTPRNAVRLAVLVAALGYFVDIYDLLLFGIVRRPSLADLHVANPLDAGVFLDNMQMGAMLLGGILWGILGDKRGRLSVLFGSIVMYSIANIANGFVQNVFQYAVARFFAGIGLAGELGAGITLVSESLPAESRGYGTTLVATVGILGAVVAALVGKLTTWRISYFIGGGLGLALLLLRVGVMESGMFQRARSHATVTRGDFFALFTSWARLRRYAAVILVGVPIWWVVGVLVKYCDAIGLSLGLPHPPDPALAILFCYSGLAVGDLASGALSQRLRSRRRAVLIFLSITVAGVIAYFTAGARSIHAFYACCAVVGIGAGYWAVFITSASEQFGTNLRATATTTAPNFVRSATVPLTLSFAALKNGSLGVSGSALAVGIPCLVLAFASLASLPETYGRDLDFVDD
jgi:predicted MFS family arabinose efflux permease